MQARLAEPTAKLSFCCVPALQIPEILDVRWTERLQRYQPIRRSALLFYNAASPKAIIVALSVKDTSASIVLVWPPYSHSIA